MENNRSALNEFTFKPLTNSELYKVENDMLIALKIENLKKIYKFIEICAVCSTYSKLLYTNLPNLTVGFIITDIKNKNCRKVINDKKLLYEFTDLLKYIPNQLCKVNLVIGSCIIENKDQYDTSIDLLYKIIEVARLSLLLNGILVIHLPIDNNINIVMSAINHLSKYFKEYKLWKSSYIWKNQFTFYFIGYEFIEPMKIMPRFSTEYFEGNDSEYYNIWNKLRKIIHSLT